MVLKTKIGCPACSGTAALSKTSLRLFNGMIELKQNPIYECGKCGEKFATGGIIDDALDMAKKEFGFARQIVSTGGSLAITIPADLAEFYRLKKGEKIKLVPESRKIMKVEIC